MSAFNLPPDPPVTDEPCDVLPNCPICAVEALTKATQREGVVICVCRNCGTALSVPVEALRHMKTRLDQQT